MRKVFFFLLALILAARHPIPASAAEISGSISLTLPGGNLRLYQVAEICDDGISYLPSGGFTDWSGSLEELSPALAEELAEYALDSACSYQEARPLTDGCVFFPELQPGLYLLVQTEAAPGYEQMAPFLVSLTNKTAHIDADPKFQLTPLPTQPLPTLPQTGQLNWPVPVLGGSGILLFLAGLVLQRRRHG